MLHRMKRHRKAVLNNCLERKQAEKQTGAFSRCFDDKLRTPKRSGLKNRIVISKQGKNYISFVCFTLGMLCSFKMTSVPHCFSLVRKLITFAEKLAQFFSPILCRNDKRPLPFSCLKNDAMLFSFCKFIHSISSHRTIYRCVIILVCQHLGYVICWSHA